MQPLSPIIECVEMKKLMILPKLEPIEFMVSMKQVCEPIWLQLHLLVGLNI
jgi:hypothetical protein